MKPLKLIILCCVLIQKANAQNFIFTQKVNHQLQNNQKFNAWVGGLNSPQISPIDLNQDGTDDIFIYDRANQKVYTFLAQPAEKKYLYAPEYEKFFPEFDDAGWVLLHDYNFDGKKDIFAGYNFGVEAYLNVSSSQLAFQKTYNILLTESSNVSFPYNLAIFSTDIPAFYDIDADGDLDVLFLDFHNGLIELHLNRSRERYGNANFLEFERINYCWGDFLIQELNCDDIVFNIACPFNNLRIADGRKKILHTGSAVLLTDLNNDNLLDIMLSGVSCDKTYVMLNQGTNKGAVFRSFTTNFPPAKPIDIGIFAALYSFDVTFDGKKDLIVASNLKEDENGNADFSKSIWLYENRGSNTLPDWQFVQTDFLQSAMLDVGQDSAPAFVDYDGDGDLDMFVGNSFYTIAKIPASKQKFATIHFYRNQGTREQANFVLENTDFFNL
ncbi:MAG: VCBS repeat-containing protein, partial [Raineya sp.]|nr:VCBS repeat-containing protein [Raineya sp.]